MGYASSTTAYHPQDRPLETAQAMDITYDFDDPEGLGELADRFYASPTNGAAPARQYEPGQLGARLTDAEEEAATLMTEPFGGHNHGRYRPTSDAGVYVDEYGRAGLDTAPWVVADFLSGNTGHGWSAERPQGGQTGRPVGRPPMPVTDTGMDAVRQAVGWSVGDFKRLTRRGRHTAAEAAERKELARRVAAVLRSGRGKGVVKVMAAAYGCGRSTLERLRRQGLIDA
jgi:hypothetical protein